MTTIHIKNGRVLDPSNNIDEVKDVCVEDGKIVNELSGTPETVIDATGLWVTPGLIDVHVHLREPGFENKETIETGCAAAAAGGFTTIVAMPNTNPCADNEAVLKHVMEKAAALGGTKVIQSCAITKGRKGEELVDFQSIAESTGVTVFTDDGDGVSDDAVMENAFVESKKHNIILAQHAEFEAISKKAAIHDGEISKSLSLEGQPIESEEKMVLRDIELLKKHGGKLHVSHISSTKAVDAVRKAKKEGLDVTAEVTPHHLFLSDEAVLECGTIAKVAPPLRPFDNVEACRAALADGTIDVVATDHAPHTLDDKSGDLNKAAFGMVGLEISVPMLLELVAQGLLTELRMIDAMSCKPANIFGLEGGSLSAGQVADITLINPKRAFEIDPRDFKSKGINTPFAGVVAPGKPVLTIVNGKQVFSLLD